ncbi:MAG: hypothetical protein QM611_05240 [Microbacterium sp.]|uniref:hypothetical protein n=1 Tax=Microbacterium sp. TaxID=51671 RepID=UPI0039E2D744
MRSPRPLPTALGAAFAVHDAKRLGVTDSRLRARDLDAPFWGVRARPAPPPRAGRDDVVDLEERDALRRIELFRPRMPAHAFLSHASAARRWRIPLPVLADTDVHVGVFRPHRAPRGAGVHGHQLSPDGVEVMEQGGWRVAGPASTWAQLGQLLSVRDLVAAGDALVNVPRDAFGRRLPPEAALATIAELEQATASIRRIGAGKLRNALQLVRVGASSRPESHLRLELVAAGLPEPELDVDILNAAGRKLGHSELVYPQFRVVVEYEGDHHRTSARQWNRDIERYEKYAAAGWRVVRITREHLYERPGAAVARVRAELVKAGWRG